MRVFRGLVLLAVVLLAGCRAERAAFRFQPVADETANSSMLPSENRPLERPTCQAIQAPRLGFWQRKRLLQVGRKRYATEWPGAATVAPLGHVRLRAGLNSFPQKTRMPLPHLRVHERSLLPHAAATSDDGNAMGMTMIFLYSLGGIVLCVPLILIGGAISSAIVLWLGLSVLFLSCLGLVLSLAYFKVI